MINLTYYKGKDLYSDGDIENEILDLIKKKIEPKEIIKNDNRWAILYHLSSDRRNLLEWYPFEENSSLLEIGAGCGALTGLFCERVKSVTAVELSKRRAEIIEARYKEYDNLEIIAGNFSEIDFNTQYNYITLIGVLEYAKKFVDDNNPISSFLSRISNLLKKDGKIIIAIENRFGLKYFAGAPEDHTGLLFNSIEGYNNNVGIETFGKNELINILTTNNFKDISFYYPYPDYKLPQTIYSDLFLPDFSEFLTNAINYDQKRYQLFNERLAFPNIINNQLFDIFSNSFLIFAEK